MSNSTVSRKQFNKLTFGTQLVETLKEAFSPDDIVQCMEEMLNAEIETKGGNIRPDYRTRERAVALWLAYTVGTPVQRQEQVNYNMDMSDLNEDELISKLSQSPAMLTKVQAMLDKAREVAD